MTSAVGSLTPWASATRASHVRVRLGAYKELAPFADLKPDRYDFVLAGFGQRVVVDRGGFIGFNATSPIPRASQDGSLNISSSFPVLSAGGLFLGSAESDFDGALTGRQSSYFATPTGRTWARRLGDTEIEDIYQNFERGTHESDEQRELYVLATGVSTNSLKEEFLAGHRLHDTEGMGAIFESGGFVLATRKKQLVIVPLPAKHDSSAVLRPSVRVPLSYKPYEISIAAGKVALLEATGGPGASNAYSFWEELFLSGIAETVKWNTTLHLHDTNGAERWRATVPFAVLQPPIDQERGRVLLAGFGLASIEGGKVIFSQRSNQRCLATAGLDGDFALVTGGELRIVARNGSIRQVFHVREGEVITTPPAIAEDGSVWVATDKALYVAR